MNETPTSVCAVFSHLTYHHRANFKQVHEARARGKRLLLARGWTMERFNATYEWEVISEGSHVPRGLEVKMQLGGKNTGRIPPKWTLKLWMPIPLERYIRVEVHRTMLIDEILAKMDETFAGYEPQILLKKSHTVLEVNQTVEEALLFKHFEQNNLGVELCLTQEEKRSHLVSPSASPVYPSEGRYSAIVLVNEQQGHEFHRLLNPADKHVEEGNFCTRTLRGKCLEVVDHLATSGN